MTSRISSLGIGFGLIVVVTALMFMAPSNAQASHENNADEIFFYRNDGLYRYYNIKPNGDLGSPILAGDGYTTGWDAITAIDLDGDTQDEIFFYRNDGLYRYYNIKPNGDLGSPILAGDGYTTGWDAITAIDLDGDNQDEIFFYRNDGLYRYYNIKPNGDLGSPILAGDGYTTGWDAITAIDLDGDNQDEIFFYRNDGNYQFHTVSSNGALSKLIREGNDYSAGWSAIASVDLNGDGRDEIFFYRDDGLYRYYDIRPDGTLPTPLRAGDGYTTGWDAITAINLDGDLPIERVSRFTTFFNCCENRVTNIRLMASQLDGHVVLPGDTFSLDETLGPRTEEDGYVGAPYLENGEGACCVIGGGVSQFGTTIHNAVFWGGYEVVEHKPHSIWISRYPLGIEATLFYGSIDYKFTNNTTSPVTIRTSSTSTSVTVELWGNQGGWQIRGWHPRGARESSIRVLDSGGHDAKRVSASVTGSAPGPVQIDRFLTRDGVSDSQTWYWWYSE